MYGVTLNLFVVHFRRAQQLQCTKLHKHSTFLAVVRRELNSQAENRTDTSLDADQPHIHFNFTGVCRVKQARSPQVGDANCIPNLVKNIKERQHLGDLSGY
jgi:hypothetical protein